MASKQPKKNKPTEAKKPRPEIKEKQDTLVSVKGMRDLIGKEYYAYQGFFEKAAEIAHYYGFKPIETPILEHTSLFTSGVGEGTDIVEKEMYTLKTRGGDQLSMRPEGTAPIMRSYIENGMQSLPQPVMLYYAGPFFRHERPQRGRMREFRQFGIEIIGNEKSIADAMVIKILLNALEEAGLTGLRVDINSIGDKECRVAYRRALLTYYKKRLGSVCADCKERFKKNPMRMLDCKNEQCQPIKAEAPDTVSFLCPACKQHFKEVLEYLETLGIDYRINPALVRGLDYYSRTVFEIIATEEPAVVEAPAEDGAEKKEKPEPIEVSVAGGGRYDYLARALGSKKDIPGVGGAIGVDRVLMSKEIRELAPRIIKKPKIFFIQLGFEAKLHSMVVIEILRKARIPIAQSLSKDSLGVQLATAERMKIPYTIILGQKEVIEGTVIVRNMDTRSQDTVLLANLPEYIKKLK